MKQKDDFRVVLNKFVKGANEIMETFIEITEKFDGIKICLPVKEIKSVSIDKNGDTFIETGKDEDGNATGIYCRDTYQQIVVKLLKYIL